MAKDSARIRPNFMNFLSSISDCGLNETELLLITTVRNANISGLLEQKGINSRIFVLNHLDFIETGYNFGIENAIGDNIFLINLDDFVSQDFTNVLEKSKTTEDIIAIKPRIIRRWPLSILKSVFNLIYRIMVGHSINDESISILRIPRSEINNSWSYSNPVVNIRRLTFNSTLGVNVIKTETKIKKSRFYRDDIAKGLLLLTTSSTKLLRILSTSSILFSGVSGIQSIVFLVQLKDADESLASRLITFELSVLFCIISFAIAIVFELIIAEINNRNVSGSANLREIGKFGIFNSARQLNVEVANLD